MKEEISAGIILFNKLNEKFLLLNYPSKHWDFVKGKMEKGETPHETAIRETKEETGITDIEFIDGFKEEISYTLFINHEEINKKVIFYLAKTNSTEIKISEEHLDFIWLNFKDAIDKITYQNARAILTKANNLLQDRI